MVTKCVNVLIAPKELLTFFVTVERRFIYTLSQNTDTVLYSYVSNTVYKRGGCSPKMSIINANVFPIIVYPSVPKHVPTYLLLRHHSVI